MHRPRTLGLLFGLTALSATPAQNEASFRYRPLPSFDVILPAETWRDGADGIAIAHRDGDRFASEVDGLSVRIDSDGDGRLDTTKKGASGFLVLDGKRPDGAAFPYAVRLRLPAAGGAYQYASSGAMVGALEGVPVQLIDQNSNGIYNEVGIDAIVIGHGRAASFLSRVVNLRGELYELEVDAEGTTATTRPYAGPTGTLDVRRGLKLLGSLDAVVVSNPTRTLSFELAGARDGLKVPVGDYVFSAGFASKGGDTARLRSGKMKPMVVEESTTTTPQWGVPLVAEFGFTREEDTITVQPRVAFLGRAGEEWHTILPDAKSPKLLVFDKDKDRLLATKRFEGC